MNSARREANGVARNGAGDAEERADDPLQLARREPSERRDQSGGGFALRFCEREDVFQPIQLLVPECAHRGDKYLCGAGILQASDSQSPTVVAHDVQRVEVCRQAVIESLEIMAFPHEAPRQGSIGCCAGRPRPRRAE